MIANMNIWINFKDGSFSTNTTPEYKTRILDNISLCSNSEIAPILYGFSLACTTDHINKTTEPHKAFIDLLSSDTNTFIDKSINFLAVFTISQ